MPGPLRDAGAGGFLPEVSPDGLAEPPVEAASMGAPDAAAHHDFIFGGAAAEGSPPDVQEHPALTDADVNLEEPLVTHDAPDASHHDANEAIDGPDQGHENDDAYLQELMKVLAQVKKSEDVLAQGIGSRPVLQGEGMQDGEVQLPEEQLRQQPEQSDVSKDFMYAAEKGAEIQRPSLYPLPPDHQPAVPAALTPEDEQMMRAMQVQQAGFHLDLSALKTLKTGLLVTGGMCSKLFGIGLMGYLAFQSMQSNAARQQQQQQRPEPQLQPRCDTSAS